MTRPAHRPAGASPHPPVDRLRHRPAADQWNPLPGTKTTRTAGVRATGDRRAGKPGTATAARLRERAAAAKTRRLCFVGRGTAVGTTNRPTTLPMENPDMTTNATTKQYLAKVAKIGGDHASCGPDCTAEVSENLWMTKILATLPEIDPAVVGQVLLHAGNQMRMLETSVKLMRVPEPMVPAYIASELCFIGARLIKQHGGDETAETSRK